MRSRRPRVCARAPMGPGQDDPPEAGPGAPCPAWHHPRRLLGDESPSVQQPRTRVGAARGARPALHLKAGPARSARLGPFALGRGQERSEGRPCRRNHGRRGEGIAGPLALHSGSRRRRRRAAAEQRRGAPPAGRTSPGYWLSSLMHAPRSTDDMRVRRTCRARMRARAPQWRENGGSQRLWRAAAPALCDSARSAASKGARTASAARWRAQH